MTRRVWLAQQTYLGKDNGLRLDDELSDFQNALMLARRETENSEDQDEMIGILLFVLASSIIEEMTFQNLNELKRFLSQYMGEVPEFEFPYKETLIASLITILRGRIQHYLDVYFTKIEKLINDYRQEKITLESLLNKLTSWQTFLPIAVAKFLARDLVGTYNSKLQSLLFQTLGISTYLWNTMSDEKVRGNPDGLYPRAIPSHFAMEGIICQNNNEFVYSIDDGTSWLQKPDYMEKAHPGEAPNCRCTRVPYIIPILKKIDKSL